MKGTATMPTHGLSAGTRQCACGGWTRFIVCQYCGTTDPAFAAAGMVSITPLVVPARDADPQAIPPAAPVAAPAPSEMPTLPVLAAPVGPTGASADRSLDAGDYAGLEAAASRMVQQRKAAPVAPPAPFADRAAPAAPEAGAPAANLAAAFDMAAPSPDTAAGATPVPTPVSNPLLPPGALVVPPPSAESSPSNSPFTKPISPPGVDVAIPDSAPVEAPAIEPPVSLDPDEDENADAPSGGRPRWLIPAIGVAVVAVAGAAYLLFGGGSSDNSSGGAVPKGTQKFVAPVVKPGVAPAATGAGALLVKTAPADATPNGAPITIDLSNLSNKTPALTGRPPAGITAAALYIIHPGGALEYGTALTFATPAAAGAFAAGPQVSGTGWKLSVPSAGINLWTRTADGARAVSVANGTTAYVLSAPNKTFVPALETWAKAITSA